MRRPRLRKAPIRLGSIIQKALALVGITEEKVTELLGRECGCKGRAERLNRLSDWAYTLIRGESPMSVPEATVDLDKIINEPSKSVKARDIDRGLL